MHKKCFVSDRIREFQQKRRDDYLRKKREIREQTLENFRTFLDNLKKQSTETERYRPRVRKPKLECVNKLMLSEWLITMPMDFNENWFFKLCPNQIKSYDKNGYLKSSWISEVRYENHQVIDLKNPIILDCIMCKKNKTFYVLDFLTWNSLIAVDCEAEFRFFWLKSKLQESQTMSFIATGTRYKFEYVDHYGISDLQRILNVTSQCAEQIDGLLFYQYESIYTHGYSPLFGWLKIFMLPEMLAINVPNQYMTDRPVNYSGYLNFIAKFNSKSSESNKLMQIDNSDSSSDSEYDMDFNEISTEVINGQNNCELNLKNMEI